MFCIDFDGQIYGIVWINSSLFYVLCWCKILVTVLQLRLEQADFVLIFPIEIKHFSHVAIDKRSSMRVRDGSPGGWKSETKVRTSLNKQQCEIKTLIHKIDNRSNVSIDIRSVELLPMLHVRTPNSFVMRRFRFALMNNRYYSCALVVYPN